MKKKHVLFIFAVSLTAQLFFYTIPASAVNARSDSNLSNYQQLKKGAQTSRRKKPADELKGNAQNSRRRPLEDDESSFFKKLRMPRIGPMVGFSLIGGINIGVESIFEKTIGLAFTYSPSYSLNLFAAGVQSYVNNQISDFTFTSLSFIHQQAEFRASYFPMKNSFFISLAVGQKHIELDGNAYFDAKIPLRTQTDRFYTYLQQIAQLYYLTPGAGFLYAWDGKFGNFAIGTDFGIQIPVSYSSTVYIYLQNVNGLTADYIRQTKPYMSMKSQLENMANRISHYPMPYWNIIKVGWLF